MCSGMSVHSAHPNHLLFTTTYCPSATLGIEDRSLSNLAARCADPDLCSSIQSWRIADPDLRFRICKIKVGSGSVWRDTNIVNIVGQKEDDKER